MTATFAASEFNLREDWEARYDRSTSRLSMRHYVPLSRHQFPHCGYAAC